MTDPSATITSIGLPFHPALKDIIDHLRDTADRLHTHGPKAIELAAALAARGYPFSTISDGGPRGTDGTSSTERAAGVNEDTPRTDQWEGVDVTLAAQLAVADRAATTLDRTIANIVHHAEDLDPVPVGTGECQACGRFCRPTKDRAGFRLRSGLCPSCYGAWRDAGRPDPRGDWVRDRRHRLTDANGKIHPQDDSHIDMTREK